MMVITPATAHSTTGNPLSAGTNRPFTTDNRPSSTDNLPSSTANRPSSTASQPSAKADRTGWFGAMTKKNAI